MLMSSCFHNVAKLVRLEILFSNLFNYGTSYMTRLSAYFALIFKLVVGIFIYRTGCAYYFCIGSILFYLFIFFTLFSNAKQ